MGRIVLAFLLLSSVVGYAQTIGGSWSGKIALMPTLGLDNTKFELSYTFGDWTLTSRSEFFGADGWVWQGFEAKGKASFMEAGALTLFGPKAPAFLYSMAWTSFDITGVNLKLYTAYVGPDVPGYFFSGGPSGGMVAVATGQWDSASVRAEVGIGARLTDPWALFTITYTGIGTYTKNLLIDPFPGGFRFTYLELTLKGLSFCCDKTFDLELYFSKENGFEYVKVSAQNLIQLCCDISLDATVTFAVDSKSVSIEPHWPGIKGCLSLYGDVSYAGGMLEGLRIYGFKVYCELQNCYSLEILSALRPDIFYVVDEKLLVAPAHLPPNAELLFQDDEFEYAKLSACGSSCCGTNWTITIWSFFRSTTGTLFGLSRFIIEAEVPLAEKFKLHPSMEVAIPSGPSLDIGWEFSF